MGGAFDCSPSVERRPLAAAMLLMVPEGEKTGHGSVEH
jgi:hypothetical protein